MTDPYQLDRFVVAQNGVYDSVVKELTAGKKTSHWMWYVFPQMEGVTPTPSATSKYYAIYSAAEARQYLAHPVLGPRLIQCTEIVLALEERTLHDIFGYPDQMKFCSSMTLFEAVSDTVTPFRHALDKYSFGERDARTIQLLKGGVI